MLFSPDSFQDDWYGYLTNQVSHISLGVFLTWVLCFISFLVVGELPYKIEIFSFLAVLYFLYELLFQGWHGLDTIEDWVFFSLYGVLGTVVTFTEVASVITLNLIAPTIIFPVLILHLFVGCLLREFNG